MSRAWDAAKERLVARWGNYSISDLDNDEASVVFSGLVVLALQRGSTLDEIHAAVDSAATVNSRLTYEGQA